MKRSLLISLTVSALVLSACQEDFAVKDVYEICESITCGDHGSCVPTSAISAICVCDGGYHNSQENPLICEEDVDPCANVTCGEHGACLKDSKNAPVCVCDSGYHKDDSDALSCVADVDPCLGVNCSGSGTCVNSGGVAVCICDNGFHNNEEDALSCDADVDYCSGVTCGEHGACVISGDKAVCVCDKDYHNSEEDALVCVEDVNPCKDVFCNDHGVCRINSSGAAVCMCDAGFHATIDAPTTCEEDVAPVNPCDGVECSGHGVCILNSLNAAICMCELGYRLVDSVTCEASSVDNNGNYLKDAFETAIDQGISCRASHDKGCSTGFCDSFIDYRCSTKCTDDSQCINENYLCRSDGRCAPKEFETVWVTSNDAQTIEFPGGNGICNYSIDWGDGNSEEIIECKETVSHTYTSAGTYHIKVTGELEGWACNNHCGDLTEVLSFGPVGLAGHAFEGATKLSYIAATDIPNADSLTDMSYMFSVTGQFKADLNRWDTSKTTTMEHTFEFSGLIDSNRSYSTFNINIADWDTSKVTSMAYMFLKAQLFNKDISNWDTSHVTTMEGMFSGASSFNYPLSNWNTSNVTTMRVMFKDAVNFNSNVAGWNTSNVTTMRSMFSGATSFNQPLGHWNMSSITDLSYMFNDASSYDGTGMSTWRPGHLTDISGMCLNAKKFNEPLTLWSVEMVKDNHTYIDAFKNTSLSLENFNKMRNTNGDWKEMSVVDLGLPY